MVEMLTDVLANVCDITRGGREANASLRRVSDPRSQELRHKGQDESVATSLRKWEHCRNHLRDVLLVGEVGDIETNLASKEASERCARLIREFGGLAYACTGSRDKADRL